MAIVNLKCAAPSDRSSIRRYITYSQSTLLAVTLSCRSTLTASCEGGEPRRSPAGCPHSPRHGDCGDPGASSLSGEHAQTVA